MIHVGKFPKFFDLKLTCQKKNYSRFKNKQNKQPKQVLGLLKYKPAPIYILDEVDSALDLSHTQNIGIMIKQYFPQSQFIVVSLKSGFFDNANVLFETSFVDGCSRVKRSRGRGHALDGGTADQVQEEEADKENNAAGQNAAANAKGRNPSSKRRKKEGASPFKGKKLFE